MKRANTKDDITFTSSLNNFLLIFFFKLQLKTKICAIWGILGQIWVI